MRTLFALAVCFVACARPDQPSKTSAADASLQPAPAVSGTPTAGNAESTKPQTAEACKATCNGDWAAHGMMGVVSCLCRTTDVGKDCRDKAECQGECLLDPVRTQVVSQGPPTTGYFVGKCSEFVTTFGCTRRIPVDTKERGPVDLSEVPPEICQD